MPYRHGVFVEEVVEGLRPLATADNSTIGIVATADDADAAVFPLNKPVLATDLIAAAGAGGDGGTLAPTLEAIAKQANANTVVVRVAEDADAAAQDANVIGGDAAGQKTGMQALLAAETQLGIKPQILGTPGLDTLAVATDLIAVAQKLDGMSYIHANGAETKEDATTYRGNFSAREAMVIWPHFSSLDAIAVALGTRAKIDQAQGWNKTISNVGVNGATGLAADISFDLSSTDHDAHYLNSNDVTTIIQRNGFRFWGSRTCSDDPLFAFESTVRTGQVIKRTIGDGLMWAIDKPLTPNLARDIVETVNAKLRTLVAQGRVIGAEVWFDPNANPVSELSAGNLWIDYDYTATAPLEALNARQRVTGRHYANFSI